MKRLCSMFLVLCVTVGLFGSAALAAETSYQTGTYTAAAQGMAGDAEVPVTFSDTAIAEAKAGATETEVQQGEDQVVDVVIVGAGLAGIMAAYEFKENHPEVSCLVLEKLHFAGGSLRTTSGAIIATDAKLFTDGGFASTTEDITEMFKRTSDADVRGQLIENVFTGSGKLLDQLIDWNVIFKVPPILSSPKYSEKVFAIWAENGGAGFHEGLQAHLNTEGINLVTGTKVTELIVTDGAATGVKAETKYSTYQVHAKAVLLATGGFGSSPEHVAKYAPKYIESIVNTHAGATGDGFDLTRQFGTKIVGDGVMGSPCNEKGQEPLASTFIVNAKGERFVDETEPEYAIIRAMGDGDGFAYMLVDADYQDQEALSARELLAYDSLEALAEAFNFDKTLFLAAVENYNQAVDAGDNPEFGLPAASAQKLDHAPFYAEKIVLRYFGTIPGIEISDEFEVLNGDGMVVKGLYAAGELTAGNAFTRQYPGGGVGISYAANSGRAAAEKIASDLK